MIYFILIFAALPNANAIFKCMEEESRSWPVIPISRAKGGIPLTAFGCTSVRIWSEKAAIRVSHSNTRIDHHTNKKSYFQSIITALLDNAQTNHTFSVNPSQDHYFRVERSRITILGAREERLCYEAHFSIISFWRILPLIVGLWLFYNARSLSSMLTFHYCGGIGVGVCLAGLGLVFLLARMVPRRGGFISVFIGGSTFLAWIGSRFYDQALEIIQSYPWLVSIYVFVTAIISFIACYWFEEGLKSPRYQRITSWFLQLIGLLMVLVSSWNIFLNFAVIGAVLLKEFANYTAKYHSSWPFIRQFQSSKTNQRSEAVQRPNFFSPMKLFNRRRLRPQTPKKEFLTQEQFQAQGKVETDHGITELRESIKRSPDPWKVLKTLRPETRAKLIDFVDSGDHLSEDTWDAAEKDDNGDNDLYDTDEERNNQSSQNDSIRARHNSSPRTVKASNGTPKHGDLRRHVTNKNMRSTHSWRY